MLFLSSCDKTQHTNEQNLNSPFNNSGVKNVSLFQNTKYFNNSRVSVQQKENKKKVGGQSKIIFLTVGHFAVWFPFNRSFPEILEPELPPLLKHILNFHVKFKFSIFLQ